jgi:hypothetical protein
LCRGIESAPCVDGFGASRADSLNSSVPSR